jgi:hypothetical protein
MSSEDRAGNPIAIAVAEAIENLTTATVLSAVSDGLRAIAAEVEPTCKTAAGAAAVASQIHGFAAIARDLLRRGDSQAAFGQLEVLRRRCREVATPPASTRAASH